MTVLLITDLDGTIMGDPNSPREFARWHRLRANDVQIVYASGRFCRSMADDILKHRLPEAVALIGGVGSEIQLRGEASTSIEWETEISHCWNSEEVRRLLSKIDGLVIQPDECQSEFKASYFVPNATRDMLETIRKSIETPWLRVELIYSSNRDLDVLPAGVNKGSAAVFVINVCGIDFDRILVAGDSGNDRSLFELGFPGVVVANAQEDMKQLVGQHIYHAQQAFARGVVEGVEFWLQEQAATDVLAKSTAIFPAAGTKATYSGTAVTEAFASHDDGG